MFIKFRETLEPRTRGLRESGARTHSSFLYNGSDVLKRHAKDVYGPFAMLVQAQVRRNREAEFKGGTNE
jgi:hypothetical protein